jgi:membrane-associated phospholipid phosphatase
MISRGNPLLNDRSFFACDRPRKKSASSILAILLFLSPVLYAQDSLRSDAIGKGGTKSYLVDSTVIPPKSKGRFLKAFIVPIAVGGFAALSEQYRYRVRDWRNENYPHFKTMSDDVIQYAPMIAVYALHGLGIRGKNDIPNATALMVKGAVVTTALFFVFKYTQHELRPDGSDFASYPSGHTEQAFAAATFLHKEYGHRSVWYTIAGYTVATGVGAMRILNNKHWLPDVLVGAAAGILAVNLVYLNHQYRWGKNYKKKKKNQALILPTYGRGPGIYFCLKLK